MTTSHNLNQRCISADVHTLNTLRPRQDGRHFADDIFKCILLNEGVWIPNKISLKFVPMGRINNIPSLLQIMAWRRPGDKPLSEPMLVSSLTHICVTRSQWVKMVSPWSWYIGIFYIAKLLISKSSMTKISAFGSQCLHRYPQLCF